MTLTPSRGFRRLTIVSAVVVYILMLVGGIVRITGSGLGCPDWPLCYGQPVPPAEMTAIIEYSHRSVALIGGLLLIGVAFSAWRCYRDDRWITLPALLTIALLVIQIPLGAVVVATELRPLMVAFHLGMAMLIFGNALAAAAAANRPANMPAIPAWYRNLLGSTMAALFILMLTGALVVGSGASHICQGWPLCGEEGNVLLHRLTPAEAVSMYHRYVVAVVSILVVASAVGTFRLRRPINGMRGWAVALGALFVAQIAVGAVQVTLDMPLVWRVLHLATATGVWASLVVLMALTLLSRSAVAAHARKASGLPAVSSAAD